MDNRITELQQNLFGWLHDFHVERNGMWLDVLREKPEFDITKKGKKGKKVEKKGKKDLTKEEENDTIK